MCIPKRNYRVDYNQILLNDNKDRRVYIGGGTKSAIYDFRASAGQVELRVALVAGLDRETQGRCAMVIWAADGGSPSLTTSTRVDVVVDDVNDNAPAFHADSYEAWIPENLAVGTSGSVVDSAGRGQGKAGGGCFNRALSK